MFCNNCKGTLAPDDLFCESCGTKVPQETPELSRNHTAPIPPVTQSANVESTENPFTRFSEEMNTGSIQDRTRKSGMAITVIVAVLAIAAVVAAILLLR